MIINNNRGWFGRFSAFLLFYFLMCGVARYSSTVICCSSGVVMRVYECSVRWRSGEKEFKSSLTDAWNASVAFVAFIAAVALSQSVSMLTYI